MTHTTIVNTTHTPIVPTGWTLRCAEWILPAHPDKLCDAICDRFVGEAMRREARALVGVEAAVHRSSVFITGRIACADFESIDVEAIVRDVYRAAGYHPDCPPSPDALRIVTDLDIGPLCADEARIRSISDDQSIITGYAQSTAASGGLPPEHVLARSIAKSLFNAIRASDCPATLGPDAKVLVLACESPDRSVFRLDQVTISLQYCELLATYEDGLRVARSVVDLVVERFSQEYPGFECNAKMKFLFNPCGDFGCGGPLGDNGLAGKKLVVDYYGPRVPIGGGAMSGKDFWKVDRAGPLIAREVAQYCVARFGLRACTVTLAISPGDRVFQIVNVDTHGGVALDCAVLAKSLTSGKRVDLRLSCKWKWFRQPTFATAALWGHFFEASLDRYVVQSATSELAHELSERAIV